MKSPRSNNPPKWTLLLLLLLLLSTNSILATAASISIAQHLKQEHDRRNNNANNNVHPASSFAIGIRDHDATADMPYTIEVRVMEARPAALLPSALFSIYGRESRAVGELGTALLVADASSPFDNHDDHDDGGDYFALLAVNKATDRVAGVVGIPNGERLIAIGIGEEFPPVVIQQQHSYSYSSSSAVVPQQQTQQQSQQQVINLYLEIDYQFIKHSGGGTLCNTFDYINSLVTAANSVLEKMDHHHPTTTTTTPPPRVNVVYVNQTTLYNNNNNIHDEKEALHRMKSGYGNIRNWHYEGIHLHYALLGRQLLLTSSDDDNGGDGTTGSIICDPREGFGILSGMMGSFDNLDGRFIQDVQRFVDKIG